MGHQEVRNGNDRESGYIWGVGYETILTDKNATHTVSGLSNIGYLIGSGTLIRVRENAVRQSSTAQGNAR